MEQLHADYQRQLSELRAQLEADKETLRASMQAEINELKRLLEEEK